jgi:pimeloyl-ACP methyl ester carboxylesterase
VGPIAGLECNGKRRQLFVVLHAFCQSPQRMQPIKDAIKDAYPDGDIFAPKLPFAGKWGWLCTHDAPDVVADLIRDIDKIFEDRKALDGQEYASVNLVGHSMGAVFARKIAIVAHGERKRTGPDAPLNAPFEAAFEAYREKPRSWASRIERIVLLAGMNRGWSTSSAMDWLTSTWWTLSSAIGETVFAGSPIIFDIRQGAVFSVQTRLQWLALMHRMSKDLQRPKIVVTQLLGTIDDMVAPDDSVDYAVDSSDEGSERSYFYLEVPHSGHKDIVDLKRPKNVDAAMAADALRTMPVPEPATGGGDTEQVDGEGRYVVFRRALCDSPEKLANYKNTITRDQMNDSLPTEPDWGVTDVVFVIHGIRDKGFWTQKIARAIKQEAGGKRDFRSVTTSYGYFAMAPFVLWWVRKQKAEWLMDQYVEARANYPRAQFSYVGHSNGTYLVARALRDYPAARFTRVVLAGSVVRRDYKWRKLVDERRVQAVLNYVATGDWVVAIFPKGMQPIRILDLGSAGHDGFKEASDHGPVRQISYIVGSHGAGHQERHWGDIARFIVSGNLPQRDARKQSRLVRFFGHCSTGLLIFLLVVVPALGFLIAQPAICQIPEPQWLIRLFEWCRFVSCPSEVKPGFAAWRTFAALLYFWLVYIVISRV